MTNADHYLEVLGLPPDASQQEIKEAYTSLYKLWHPDCFQDKSESLKQQAREKFKEFQNAYQALMKMQSIQEGKKWQAIKEQLEWQAPDLKQEVSAKPETIATSEAKTVGSANARQENARPRQVQKSLDAGQSSISRADVTTQPQYAGFWLRTAAILVDSVIMFIPNIIMSLVGISFGGWFGMFVLSTTVWWLYQALMESSDLQASIGKRMVGIIVIDYNGERISFGKATGRYFAKIISMITVGIGFLMIAFSKNKQALHDKLANTYVVKKGSINTMALVVHLSFYLYILIIQFLQYKSHPSIYTMASFYGGVLGYAIIPLIPLIIFNLTRQRHRGLGIACVVITSLMLVFTLIGTLERVSKNNELADELVRKSLSLKYSGQHSQAVTTISKAIQLRPGVADWYGYRAEWYIDLNDLKRAVADCNKAIELNPDYWGAYTMLGVIDFLSRDYDQSIRNCTKAIDLNSTISNVISFYIRGLSYYRVNNREAAFADMRTAAGMGNEEARKFLISH